MNVSLRKSIFAAFLLLSFIALTSCAFAEGSGVEATKGLIGSHTFGSGTSSTGTGCTQKTCAEMGFACGSGVETGCNKTISCGSCQTGTCTGNECVESAPDCTPKSCSDMGWDCGSGTETECNTAISCGSCYTGTCTGNKCVGTGACVKCVPRISSITVVGGGSLAPGKTVQLNLELGDCTASKTVLIVSTRRPDNFNLYWNVFGYPAMNEFSSVQEAFVSIEASRIQGDERFSFQNFKNFVVDIGEKSNMTGKQQISLEFTDAALEPFKAKRTWLKSKASDYVGEISGLIESDITSTPNIGFLDATRSVPDKFIDNMNFKFAVKDQCDGTWKFTDFSNVQFSDSAVPPAPAKKACGSTPSGQCGQGQYCDDGIWKNCTVYDCCPSGTACNASGQCGATTKTCLYADNQTIAANTCVYATTGSESDKPWFCGESGGEPMLKCSGVKGSDTECGCPSGQECQSDGSCKAPGSEAGPGVKPTGGLIGGHTFGSGGTPSPTNPTSGAIAGCACFIKIEAIYAGSTYEGGATVSADSSSADSISLDKGRFYLSQEGCSIQEGAEYGFWGNSDFSGTRQGGGTLTAEQAQTMSGGGTVEVSGISISGIKGFNGSKFFGMKGQVMPQGAEVFGARSSSAIEFQFGSGGTTTPPTGTKCSDGTEKGKCSATKPYYCDDSLALVNSCGAPHNCGCPNTTDICKPDGSCKSVEQLAGCDPCQSVVGCLACIDKAMAEQTLK